MTDSVGFVISLPGYPVENVAPENTSLHSSYDTFKVKLDPNNPQFGNITVTFKDTPSSGSYLVYTIHHGYGYIPDFYLFFDTRSSTALLSTEVGNFFSLDALNDAYFQAVVDIQNVTINYVVQPGSTATPSGEVFAFRFYVFANDRDTIFS